MVKKYQGNCEFVLMTKRPQNEYTYTPPMIKVFVLQDDWLAREALVSVLQKEPGMKTAGASGDVQAGIKQILSARPDIVLMDVFFEGRNKGIQATAAIKEKLPETKIIIFTEFSKAATLRYAVRAGASGFLLKGEVEGRHRLANAIRLVHRGKGCLTPSAAAEMLKMTKNSGRKRPYELTKRESQVLEIMSEGKSNAALAKELKIKIRTVANHVNRILSKMNAKNRTQAAAIARREGLVD